MSAAPSNSFDNEAARIAKALHGKRSGNDWLACCPAHEDHSPSLSIRQEGNRVLLKCHAHCTQEAIIDALREQGLWEPRPVRVESVSGKTFYVYNDEQGKPLHRTERRADKEFRQQSWQNGQWIPKLGLRTVLYHLDELIARPSETVYIAEGEKDVDRLRSLGYLSTCNPMGAGKWRDSYTEAIASRDSREVVIFYDNDPESKKFAGQDHAQKVALSLLQAKCRVRLVDLPEGKDISDYLALGHTKAELAELIANALYHTKRSVNAWRDGFENQTVEASTELPVPKSQQDLPLIDVANRQLRDRTADCLAALEAVNDPPFLFTQDDLVVRIQHQGLPERKVIAEVGQDALRGCLTRAANFRQPNPRKKGQFIQVPPPMDCVLDILTLPPAERKFPPLLSIVESPVLRPDGSILDKPGYDPSTKLFYAPTDGLDIRVKEFPAQDDARQAARVIKEVMEGFPFADERASRANMIAALLSPICRPAFEGSIPMGLFNGTTMGTGKTLATECVGIIANGRANSLTPAPTDQSEWRKKITSILLERPSLVVFDNINHRLDSPDLCLALTGDSYSDRILGISKNANVRIQWCCLGTGNNLQLGGDMARRAYWVNLDAKCSKPFQRTGFKHPDLKRWVLEHRGELLSALLTMARAWFVAGKPAAPAHPFGGFQGWTDTIGGILHNAGVEGFLENDDQLFEQADIETIQWESFLLTLHELFYGEPFLCSEIVEKLQAKTYNEEARTTELTASASRLIALLPDSVAEAADRPKALPRKIGNQFRERIGRRFGNSGVYLERGAIVHNTQQWAVRGVTEN